MDQIRASLRRMQENTTQVDVSEFFGGETLDSRFETFSSSEIEEISTISESSGSRDNRENLSAD